MWKKKDSDPLTPEPVIPPEPPPSRPPVRRSERAIIGPTLRIQGEISGGEELLVQGRIEGKIVVNGQGVTVGKSGKVKADIHARSIRIEGQVRGDLFGEQEVIIEASGDVRGNLVAPSVRLENGSRFKGSIDMEQSRQAPLPTSGARPVGPGVPAKPPETTGSASTSKPSPSGPDKTSPNP